MNTLKSLNIKYRYRSGRDDLLQEFFIPCLKTAVVYQRTAGFFSASALVSLSRGLIGLLKNNGSMQLIISPILSLEDIKAIKKGYDKRSIIEQATSREIEAITLDRLSSGVEALSWLIEKQHLDIRFAVPRPADGLNGIYHDKLGLIKDKYNNYVAFSGSINESQNALVNNYESFDVDFSWIDFKGLAKEKEQEFLELWENRTEGIDVFEFPDVLKKKLLKLRSHYSVSDFIEKYDTGDLENNLYSLKESALLPFAAPVVLPKDKQLREYQKKAISAWFKHDCKGIYKMATGSGKTITALASIVNFIKMQQANKQSTVIIIICPYKHLVEQWERECEDFNIHPICCFESRDKWQELAQVSVLNVNIKKSEFTTLLTTNTTFSMNPFQTLLKQINVNALLVADEVHNMGSNKAINLLPENIKYRLALSATPERWYDEEGTEKLTNYFGEKVIEFTLKEAIENKFLTQYYYYIHLIEFTDDESSEYLEISAKIAPLVARQLNGKKLTKQEQSILTTLLIKRARLCGTAYNKTEKLFDLMKSHCAESHILVYCGDGRLENESDHKDSIRQIEYVIKHLGTKLNMHVHPFTAYESLETRKKLIKRFTQGDLQALCAIRCLDEGVDIPSIKTAFILASSTNPRQFIQRRGRLLRRDDANGKNFAHIHDFVMLPPGYRENEFYDIDRNLLRKEIMRINEFASLAINGCSEKNKLLSLQNKYNLMDI